MSDKKKSKRRKDEYTGPGGVEDEIDKPSKQEFQVAKWLKKNVPTKKTKFLNHNVEYFTSSKALDALLASKFAQGDNCLLPNRDVAIEFMDTMLIHKFFHRAKKVPVSEAELRRGKKPASADKDNNDKEKEKEVSGEKEKADDGSSGLRKRTKEEKATDAENSQIESAVKSEKDVKEKKKRKIRLDMHPDQVFIDGPEAYVWIYDPIPMHYWLFGALLVVGAIVLCLFPLWPEFLRKGVYYLSILAAGFLLFILGLTVLRAIVFCVVWVVSGSKHHLWIFPNLTEDVGFFASFWPLYQHEYKDGNSKEEKKKRKRDKDSDAEDDANASLLGKSKIENIKENETGTVNDGKLNETTVQQRDKEAYEATEEKDNEQKDKDEQQQNKASNPPSESESESSQRSSTGKDFEIVDTDDVETS